MSSSIEIRTSFSLPLSVLIMNLLSFEKKKNEPDYPDPSPALKTIFLFSLMESDYLISLISIPSIYIIS